MTISAILFQKKKYISQFAAIFVALAEQRCPSIPKVASLCIFHWSSCEKVAAQTSPRWFLSLNFRSFFVLLFGLFFSTTE
jgi:hypothetical protein